MIIYKNGEVDSRRVLKVISRSNYLGVMFTDGSEKVLKDYSMYLDDYCGPSIRTTDYTNVLKIVVDCSKSDMDKEKSRLFELKSNEEKYEIKKGDKVKVVKGKKYPIGTTFDVLCFRSFRPYGTYGWNDTKYVLGLINGEWLKVDIRNVDKILSIEEKESIDREVKNELYRVELFDDARTIKIEWNIE